MLDLVTRPATPADATAIHGLVAARDRDLNGRAEVTLDGIAADLARPALDLARDTLLVHDPAGDLVGRAWVHRDRGIARILLQHAFHGFHRLGRRRCALWTHSDTGALSLYERLGMTIGRSSTHYSRPLTAG